MYPQKYITSTLITNEFFCRIISKLQYLNLGLALKNQSSSDNPVILAIERY